ncbi:MAG: exo-alpha-sialidase [Planctomycetes bacterium]|nr:exo-alpha-sialidase [Planctomycetota bacterium]
MRTAFLQYVLLTFFLLPLLSGAAPAGEAVLVDAAGKQPRIAVAADGAAYLVYGRGNQVVVRTARKPAAEFAPASELGPVDGLMCGMRRGPQVAVTAAAVVVAAIGKAGDIQAWGSSDGGTTWGDPVTVNDQASAAREGLFSIAASGARIWAVWIDLRSGKGEIYAAHTSDGGAHWSTNLVIYRSPDGRVCECCQPTVAGLADGGAVIMWRNALAGARDLYACTVDAEGTVTTAPAKLGSGTWTLNACPMDGGGVSAVGTRYAAIWRRDADLYLVTSAEPAKERALGPGRNAAIAAAGGKLLQAWQRDADIVLARDGAKPTVIGQGSYPVVAAAVGGAPALVAWEAPDGVRILRLAP